MNYCDLDVDKISSVLRNGGIVLSPTDTVYGLLCDANNIEAVNKIYQIKHRSLEKKLSLFFVNLDHIYDYCQVNEEIKTVLSYFLPGKFTFILDLKPEKIPQIKFLDRWVDKSIGVRIPDCEKINTIMNHSRMILASTSANISNNPDSSIFANISSEVVNSVDYVIRDNVYTENKPSTIIDLRFFPTKYNILRYGDSGAIFEKFVNEIWKIQN